MRVPDGYMARVINRHLGEVTGRMARYQTEVASGLRIQRPSDDPAGALRAASLRSNQEQITQFQATVKDANAWLKTEDVALGKIQELTRQMRNVTLQAANPIPSAAREALGKEMQTLKTNLVQAANSSDGLRFLFAGHQTMTVPFSANPGPAVAYNGDQGTKPVAIGEGVTMVINHDGAQVFNMGGVADASLPDLFTTIDNLTQAILDNDDAAIDTGLAELDTHMTRVTALRSESGTRLKQVELATDRLTQSNYVVTELLSDTESSDITEALLHLKEEQNVYQAASYVASTIAQGGLLQWLR